MKNILFLCGLYPQSLKEEIFRNSKGSFQFAAQNFQEAVIDGLINQECVDLSILSMPFISTFPFGYRKLFFVGCNALIDKVRLRCVSFLNLVLIRDFFNTIVFDIEKWYNLIDAKSRKIIIVYSSHCTFIKEAINAKKRHPDIQLVIIVPDLPEYVNCNKYYKALGLKNRDIKVFYKSVCLFDKFVLLTDDMSRKLDIEKVKYIVMEGIYKHEQSEEIVSDNTNLKIVLYTGAIERKYGIVNLIQAFSLLGDPSYRLCICGDGNDTEYVKQESMKDSRIEYKGKISHDEVKKLQSKAFLLINPRTPEGEYTQYSFPSKIMEYLASGKPTLLYRLPGIPIEYFEHCYTIDELGVLPLSRKIGEILEYPRSVLINKGLNARDFILRNKNSYSQMKKIVDFLGD